MAAINAVGKKLESIVQIDDSKRVSPEQPPTVAGTDSNGNLFRFEVSVFDRNGDGQGDMVVKRGGRVDGPDGNVTKPTTIVDLYDGGVITDSFEADTAGVVFSAMKNEWTPDGLTARSRIERSTARNSVVDRRAESTLRREGPDYFPRSGITMALDDHFETVKQHHLARLTFVSSDMAAARDKDGKNGITPDEVEAAGLRLPDGNKDEAARQAVRVRVANGD